MAANYWLDRQAQLEREAQTKRDNILNTKNSTERKQWELYRFNILNEVRTMLNMPVIHKKQFLVKSGDRTEAFTK